MTETTGTPLPPVTNPKKNNRWMIAILVAVVICCGCFGVVGLLVGFWEPIQDAFGLPTMLPIITG